MECERFDQFFHLPERFPSPPICNATTAQWLNTCSMRCPWCFFHNEAMYGHSLASCALFDVKISALERATSSIRLRNNVGCFLCLQPHSWCRWAVLGGARYAPRASVGLGRCYDRVRKGSQPGLHKGHKV